MTVSYKKLWKLLIDRDLLKKDLVELTGISPSSMAKMANNGNVNISAILKICEVLNCTMDDIMELVPEESAAGYRAAARARRGANGRDTRSSHSNQ